MNSIITKIVSAAIISAVFIYGSVASASDYEKISTLNCRAVVNSQASDIVIGTPNGMTIIKNANSSLAREVVCPLDMANNNGARTQIDQIQVKMSSDSSSKVWLYQHLTNITDISSVYGYNSAFAGNYSFTTDRPLTSSVGYYDYGLVISLPAGAVLQEIKVFFK